MNFKLLLVTAAIFAFNTIPAIACPSPNRAANFLAYQRRNNNRCEGIVRRDIAGSLSLISFASRNLTNYSNNLNLQISNINNTSPQVTIRSYEKNYILDRLNLSKNSSWFTFNLPTQILTDAGVPPNSLRAIAKLSGSQPVYVPVILNKTSGEYEFAFYTANRTKFSTFEIIYNNQIESSQPRNTFSNPNGEVIFTWDGRNASKGRYRLRVIAEIQQRGQPSERVTKNLQFQHDPS